MKTDLFYPGVDGKLKSMSQEKADDIRDYLCYRLGQVEPDAQRTLVLEIAELNKFIKPELRFTI